MEKQVDRRGRVIIEQTPYDGMRKIIGDRMLNSLNTVGQGTQMCRFDMSKLVAYREKLKEEGLKVSYTDLMAKAIAAALPFSPKINSTLEKNNITVFETVNMGIAVKVDDDLIVPVILDVGNKTLAELSEATKDTIQKTRERRFGEVYMAGATITLNNLGMYNVEACTPIVNTPETAIIAMGKIAKDAWVDENDQLCVRPVSTISISINHAVVDGGQTGMFLDALKVVLDEPEKYIK